MAGHDIIVVGASAGGVEALTTLARGLPPDLQAAVFVVLHIPANSPSVLPAILSRSGPLEAVAATDGAAIQPGYIYIAPPDHHLLVARGVMRVVRGPKENRHRPAIDPLFRSAALAYGTRTVGVVLTGALDDGTAGLLAVKARGGIAIVQNPTEALYPSMPQSAIANVEVDHILPLAEIPPLLVQLSDQRAADEGVFPVPDGMEYEARIASMDADALHSESRPGRPSVFSCPECNGVLYEINDADLVRFRCRVGHAYSPESMLEGQATLLEDALWIALNTLEESASLSRRMARQADERGQEWLARRFHEKVHEAEQRAMLLRRALLKDATGAELAEGNGPLLTPSAAPTSASGKAGPDTAAAAAQPKQG